MGTLQKIRQQYSPSTPPIARSVRLATLEPVEGAQVQLVPEEIRGLFPHTCACVPVVAVEGGEREGRPWRIGVVFSGGQAPGGHNVVAGIFDALHQISSESECIGFLGGPAGVIEGKTVSISASLLDVYRNQGGFDLLGSGRTKIGTQEQLRASLHIVQAHRLDGLVIIGGDDSTTNAALLAEYFLQEQCPTTVVGVPKTIDGDLRNPYVAISFGFDTACKIYAEMIGNIARDAMSAKKYTHFIKLMGRSASHVVLNCALETHPNLALIGEEIAEKKLSLAAVVSQIADLVQKRSEAGKDYGVILIPEGLLESIPEVAVLINELNMLLARGVFAQDILAVLSASSQVCFQKIPEKIRMQLLAQRDPHGNVQLSLVATEQLLIELVHEELKNRTEFRGKFQPVPHFFGYEGRAGFPSNFDCNYSYSLGVAAVLLVRGGKTGYMAYVRHVSQPPKVWSLGGVPIASLLHLEVRNGEEKPVIRKTLVDTNSKAFMTFAQLRDNWSIEDGYLFPGPMQFFGDPSLTDSLVATVSLDETCVHSLPTAT